MNNISPEEKIFGLSSFWLETKYNFAYFYNVPDLNWDTTYQQYLTKILKSNSNYEYYRILEQFAALLKMAIH